MLKLCKVAQPDPNVAALNVLIWASVQASLDREYLNRKMFEKPEPGRTRPRIQRRDGIYLRRSIFVTQVGSNGVDTMPAPKADNTTEITHQELKKSLVGLDTALPWSLPRSTTEGLGAWGGASLQAVGSRRSGNKSKARGSGRRWRRWPAERYQTVQKRGREKGRGIQETPRFLVVKKL